MLFFLLTRLFSLLALFALFNAGDGSTNTQTCMVCGNGGASWLCPTGFQESGVACDGTTSKDQQGCTLATSPAPTDEPIDSTPAPATSVPAPAASVPAPATSVPAPATSVPETNYLVHHNILMQGISASTFNDDTLMVESFRQAVAIVVGVPETDIIHVLASDSKRRRLSDAKCDVAYDVKVKSEAEEDTMKKQMNTKMENSTAFTTKLQTRMEANNVVSVPSNSITADTTTNKATAATEDPEDQPNQPTDPNKGNPNEGPKKDDPKKENPKNSNSGGRNSNTNDDGSSADGTSASGDGKDDTTGAVVGGVVGGLVVLALVVAAVLVVRRRKNPYSNRKKLVDTQLSNIEGVELATNPMDSGNKNEFPAIALKGKPPAPLNMPMPCDVPGWEMYMDNESGQAYYTNTATKETTWHKPDNTGKQKGAVNVVTTGVVGRS